MQPKIILDGPQHKMLQEYNLAKFLSGLYSFLKERDIMSTQVTTSSVLNSLLADLTPKQKQELLDNMTVEQKEALGSSLKELSVPATINFAVKTIIPTEGFKLPGSKDIHLGMNKNKHPTFKISTLNKKGELKRGGPRAISATDLAVLVCNPHHTAAFLLDNIAQFEFTHGESEQVAVKTALKRMLGR